MSPEVREAIEAARQAQVADRPANAISFPRAADLIRRVAENCPDGMTVAELADELSHANNQGTHHA